MNIVLTVQDSFFFWPVVHDKLLQLPVNLEWCFFVRLCCSLQSFFCCFFVFAHSEYVYFGIQDVGSN